VLDYAPVILGRPTPNVAPTGMVVEYLVPRNGKTESFQPNGKVRLVVECVKFGLSPLERVEASRNELAGVSIIPQYRKDMADEMVHFVPDGKIEKRVR